MRTIFLALSLTAGCSTVLSRGVYIGTNRYAVTVEGNCSTAGLISEFHRKARTLCSGREYESQLGSRTSGVGFYCNGSYCYGSSSSEIYGTIECINSK